MATAAEDMPPCPPVASCKARVSGPPAVSWEDKPLMPGFLVKAAAVPALLDLLIASHESERLSSEKENFPRVVLLMHQWFMTSEELLDHLISRWWKCEDLAACRDGPLRSPRGDTHRYRTQIIRTIRYWTTTFPIHFDLNPQLTSRLAEFLGTLHGMGFNVEADLEKMEKMPSFSWARHLSVYPTPGRLTRKGSLVFDNLDASELAGHITHLEHKAMRRISFTDFKSYAQTSSLRDNPKLERSIALFNGLTQWVQATVLARTSPQQRAAVIAKFLQVAKKLQRLQNFNSLMAVVGGLSHSALARLSRTAALMPTEARRTLSDLSELLSSGANFGNYRRALADCRGFKIPILGVHMKDLITLHVALPDTLQGGQVNVRKMVQLSYIFQELWNLQNSVPPIAVHQDLVSTLKIALETVYSEDEIYDLSLAREPRAFTASSKPILFSEWVLGVGSPADPITAERHVQAMVEVLFKNYDLDRDGVLCPEEFEALAANFPLLDDFSAIDTDSDGVISRSELSAYSLRSNSQVLRSGFQHDFHETTYFKPTFCAHCHGLLWGLIKQGFKCRECGLNAHKHCKEHLVMECRRQSGSPPPSTSINEKPTRKLRGRQWRKLYRSQPSDGASLEGPSPDLSPEDLLETEGLAEELKDILLSWNDPRLPT